MSSHNLRTIVAALKGKVPEIDLDSKDCKWIGDFYFDARYPGDDYVLVTKEDALECMRIVKYIRDIISKELTKFSLGCENQNVGIDSLKYL